MLNMMLDTWTSFAQMPWLGHAELSTTEQPSSEEDQFASQHYVTEQGTWKYKLFVPSAYAGEPLPLVVMLHGGGQDADAFAVGTGMNELAEQNDCFVLYPEQSCQANWSMCWNWFEDGHHHRGRGEPALIAGIVKNVFRDYTIDQRRVYVAGLSAGGAMAVILGRTYPELFAAVGSHSGLAYASATNSYSALHVMKDGVEAHPSSGPTEESSVPVIVFHGDQDFTVHPKNSVSVVQQCIDDFARLEWHEPGDTSVLEETGKERGRAFTRYIHSSGHGRIIAEHWTVAGAGHAWSGGARRGRYTDELGPNAGREMLRFFFEVRAE